MGTAGRHDWRAEINTQRTRQCRQLMLALPIILIYFGACRLNSDSPSTGADHLYGSWSQDSVALQDQLLEYTLHEFRLTPDSIYGVLRTVSRVPRIVDSCYGDGFWTEYIRGIYVVRQDSLLVEGWYRQPDGQLKTSGCHHIGKYRPRFKIVFHSADSLVLEDHIDRRLIELQKR